MDSEEQEEAKKVLLLGMNSNYDVALIHQVIQQLMEEKREQRNKTTGDCFVEDDDRVLLSRLLSQLESLKEGTAIEPSKPTSETELLSAVTEEEVKHENLGGPECGSKEMEHEEILRELRKVKRQNSVTHWLLSVMIFLTVAWQLSEVSFILLLKNKLSHPFRTVGSVVRGLLTGRGKDETTESKNLLQMEAPSVNGLKMPELPHVGLPALRLNGDDD